MKTLLGYLSQFHSFSIQGEVLCTQSLAFILRDSRARATFAEAVASWTKTALSSDLTWRAEAYQVEDAGRPDLEACTPDGSPVIKVEAKLGAEFNPAQLRSYIADLQNRSGGGILIVLVPLHRTGEAMRVVSETFDVSGESPWLPAGHPGTSIAVISWDDALTSLASTDSDTVQSHVEQLNEMYKALSGYDLKPLASSEEITRWQERKDLFIKLVDRATKRLSRELGCWMGPLGPDSGSREPVDSEHFYYRRYLCRPLGDKKPCFSIGIHHPFEGESTPIWLRFNRTTPLFSLIRARLVSSGLAERVIISGGHAWFPLDVPLDANAEQMIASLIEQAEEVIAVAYKSLG